MMTGRTADGRIETVRIVPEGSPVANYAFDVTPARLVTGLITERGVLKRRSRRACSRISRTNGGSGRIAKEASACRAPGTIAMPKRRWPATQNLGRDVALRVYTTRLLGQDPRLVLHGGGNTSVKTRRRRSQRRDGRRALRQGLRLGHGLDRARRACRRCGSRRCSKLRAREKLSDEEMVRLQRANLIDPTAPNPSVETLLHAFIPHKFVDHTHSTAVLALTDQPDGEALCREVYGKRVGYVPYIMPGFGLAKAAAEVFDADPVGRRPDPASSTASSASAPTRGKPMSA